MMKMFNIPKNNIAINRTVCGGRDEVTGFSLFAEKGRTKYSIAISINKTYIWFQDIPNPESNADSTLFWFSDLRN